MKKILKVVGWVVALAVILFGGWKGMRLVGEREAAAKEAPAAAGETGPPQVAVRTVSLGSVSVSVWVTGEVGALQSVEIVPKVAGRLERLRRSDGAPIEEGVEVGPGETVAVIEHEHLAAAVRTAEAALEVARAVHEAARVNAADALREKARWEELRRGGSGTQQQLDQAVTAYARAEAQVRQAEAQIVQAQAVLEQARVAVADATVAAPFAGVVLRKHVDEGAFVGPGTPLFRLADISEVEITGGVAGRHYAGLRTGETRAVVEVDAYPGEVFEGTVSRLRPELDSVTRTVAVTIRVPNAERKLKPGMYARTRLALDERVAVPVLPDTAIVTHGDRREVFVVNDGEVHVREVETGLQEGPLSEVVRGVRAGDRVVVRGQQLLRDGMTVVPVEVEDGR